MKLSFDSEQIASIAVGDHVLKMVSFAISSHWS